MIKLEHVDDETLVISVKEVEIATVTHDEDGWSGMQLAESIARGIGRELGIEVKGP